MPTEDYRDFLICDVLVIQPAFDCLETMQQVQTQQDWELSTGLSPDYLNVSAKPCQRMALRPTSAVLSEQTHSVGIQRGLLMLWL